LKPGWGAQEKKKRKKKKQSQRRRVVGRHGGHEHERANWQGEGAGWGEISRDEKEVK